MSTERDELATVIETAYDLNEGMASFELLAHAVLAAGYRKPRTITTRGELDALPRLSVIRSDEGAVFERHTMWHEAGSRDLMYTSGIALPATVIWEPEPRQ